MSIQISGDSTAILTNPPQQVKSVPRAIKLLESTGTDLAGVFNELQQRLGPYLSSCPSACAEEDSSAESCETAEQLCQLNRRLKSLKENISEILERLEL